MTRVDFYVLPGTEIDARLAFVCRLAEKAQERGQTVFVHADEPSLLARLDDVLWTFRPTAFVPHRLVSADEMTSTQSADPVHLSAGEPGPDRQVLINLALEVPAFFSRLERTLEVVDQDPAVRDAGRERYRFYQRRGYPLGHHRL